MHKCITPSLGSPTLPLFNTGDITVNNKRIFSKFSKISILTRKCVVNEQKIKYFTLS